MNEPTHILHWVPPYVNSDGCGRWELQTVAGYEAGLVQQDPDWLIEDEPRDIDAGDFTEWIAGMTGYPVAVEKGSVRFTCPSRLRFLRKEPLFFVVPASQGSLP